MTSAGLPVLVFRSLSGNAETKILFLPFQDMNKETRSSLSY